MASPDLPILECADEHEWERWLEANHASSPGVWLKFAKKSADKVTVKHPQALVQALRFGWIDGQGRPYDESAWLVRFTPRGPRSKWSQRNRDMADELIAQGRMTPAGLAQVDAARRDGRWEAAYPAQSAATVPHDFQRALDANPAAREFFETLTGATRYAFLYRLHHVKKPENRARRIATYIELLTARRTLHDGRGTGR